MVQGPNGVGNSTPPRIQNNEPPNRTPSTPTPTPTKIPPEPISIPPQQPSSVPKQPSLERSLPTSPTQLGQPLGPDGLDTRSAARPVTRQLDLATGVQATTKSHTVLPNETGRVVFHNPNMDMHESWRNTSLAGAMNGNALNLNNVTPEMVNGLSANNMRTFMGMLERRDLTVERFNGAGQRTTGGLFSNTTTENGATAFARHIWASGNSEAFARTFAASPDRILPHLSGNGARVLTSENMALIMREMAASNTDTRRPGFDPRELNALGSLTQRYLEFNAGSDPQRASNAMQNLLRDINNSGMPFTPRNAGVVNGAITSGMIKHFDSIRASDEQRNRILNGVFDAAAAGAGGFGPWGAVAAAGIVGLRTIYNEADRPRDFSEYANRMQGALQLEWLQNPPAQWNRDDVQDAILWTQTTILNNGRR